MMRKIFTPKLLPWLLGALLAGTAAAIITPQILLFGGWQKAFWIQLEVNAEQANLSEMKVYFNGNPSEAYPVTWENSDKHALVGIRPLNFDKPVKLLEIDTNQGPVSSEQVQISSNKWERLGDLPRLRVTEPGLIILQGTYQMIAIKFESGPDTGMVEIEWLDQRSIADLSAQPAGTYSVRLTLPRNLYHGWVLMPPKPIESLHIQASSGVPGCALRQVKVFDNAEQTWTAKDLVGGLAIGDDHRVALSDDGLIIEPSGQSACTLTLPGLKALNVVPLAARLFIWLAITSVGLVGLWGVSYLAKMVRRWETGYEITESRLGKLLREHTQGWTIWEVTLLVGIIAVAYHLSYVLSVPMSYSVDSIDYFRFGRNFMHTLSFDSIHTYRTPGYPFLISIIIWLFGDQLQALGLLQHLAVALLGPLVAWFLYRQTGPVFAGIGGLLAGLSPVISITASIVWTESIFAVFSCLALFVLLGRRNQRWWSLLLAGAFAGLATLIRPPGLVLVGVMLGFLFLKWWCNPTRDSLVLQMAQRSFWLALGIGIMVAPWLFHVHEKTGEWKLTSLSDSRPPINRLHLTGIAEDAAFINTFYQSRSPDSLAINRPYKTAMKYLTSFQQRTRILGGISDEMRKDTRLPLEMLRENIRHNPQAYLKNVREAFAFNLANISPPSDSSFFVYPVLKGMLYDNYVRSYPHKPPSGDSIFSVLQKKQLSFDEAQVLMPLVTYQWLPSVSPLRSAMLWTSQAGLRYWGIIAGLALCGLSASMLLAPYRRFSLLGLYWLGFAAGLATIAMGHQRYAMVIEPILYILGVLLLSVLMNYKLRKRPMK